MGESPVGAVLLLGAVSIMVRFVGTMSNFTHGCLVFLLHSYHSRMFSCPPMRLDLSRVLPIAASYRHYFDRSLHSCGTLHSRPNMKACVWGKHLMPRDTFRFCSNSSLPPIDLRGLVTPDRHPAWKNFGPFEPHRVRLAKGWNLPENHGRLVFVRFGPSASCWVKPCAFPHEIFANETLYQLS
jgi:hypothetical protein